MNKELEDLPHDLYRHILELIKMTQRPLTWMHSSLALFNIIILVGGVSVGAYYYRKTITHSQEMAHQLELLNTHYLIQNQQTTLLKIIDSNLRDSKEEKLGSAPIEEKVKLAQIFYEMSILEKVPLSLLCGIAEVESGWNTHAISDAGCKGILQVNPIYAKAYLREKGINYSPDIWFDPVVNSICGISMLSDFQDDAIEKGLAKEDWTFATRSYFWGPSARSNVLDMNYSLKVINASKKYKEMGL